MWARPEGSRRERPLVLPQALVLLQAQEWVLVRFGRRLSKPPPEEIRPTSAVRNSISK
jgi:hypothetical protein